MKISIPDNILVGLGMFLLCVSVLGCFTLRTAFPVIPIMFIIISFALLAYTSLVVQTKIAYLFSSSLYTSILWFIGTLFAGSRFEVILLIPYILFILATPFIAFYHHQLIARFNPQSNKVIEYEVMEDEDDDENSRFAAIVSRLKSAFTGSRIKHPVNQADEVLPNTLSVEYSEKRIYSTHEERDGYSACSETDVNTVEPIEPITFIIGNKVRAKKRHVN